MSPSSAVLQGCEQHSSLSLSSQQRKVEVPGVSCGVVCTPAPLPCQGQQLSFICLFLPQMKFEFIPRHLDITESFWVFRAPEQSISVLFLLVGKASDPLATLNRSHLNFQLLSIGEHHGYPSHTQAWTSAGAQHSRCSSSSSHEAGNALVSSSWPAPGPQVCEREEGKGREEAVCQGHGMSWGLFPRGGVGAVRGCPEGQKHISVLTMSVLTAGSAPRCRCLLAQPVGSSGLEAREQKVFNSCFVLSPGHEVHQTVYMINREKEAFSFAFRESSLFSEGCKTSVKVEPLEGCVAALSR